MSLANLEPNLESKIKQIYIYIYSLFPFKCSVYIYIYFNFFLILTRFNTYYESMRDSIYCSERCASAALFSHQKSLLSALYTITVFNARTL